MPPAQPTAPSAAVRSTPRRAVRPTPAVAGAILAAPDSSDPDAWESRAVPILPESEQEVALRDPATKRLIIDGETGQPRMRHVRFDAAKLQRIADEANARVARGHYCPAQIGHTILTDPDETHQPEPVGFLRNFRVGPIHDGTGRVIDGTPHLICDQVIRKDRLREALTYPHRSPEIDAGKETLDSLALIRRPPKYDMGLIMNARDFDATEPLLDPAEPNAVNVSLTTETPPEGEETPTPLSGETQMADEMNAANEPLTMSALDEKLGPIVEALHLILEHIGGDQPAEGDGQVQNADTMPGGDNSFPPALAKEDDEDGDADMQNCDGLGKAIVQNQRDSLAIAEEVRALKAETVRLRAELDASRDEVGELLVHNARESVEHAVEELEAEGLVLGNKAEIKDRLLSFTDEASRAKEIDFLKRHCSRNPVGVPRIKTANGGSNPAAGSVSRDQIGKITAYATQNGMSFKEAKAKCMASGIV